MACTAITATITAGVTIAATIMAGTAATITAGAITIGIIADREDWRRASCGADYPTRR